VSQARPRPIAVSTCASALRLDLGLCLNLDLCLCLYLEFGPSLYLTLHVRKHRPKRRRLHLQLRRRIRRQLNPALNLELHRPLYAAFYDKMLAPLYPSSNPSLFASLDGASYREKYGPFDGPIYPQLCRQLLPPRRPGGRSPHGQIVVKRNQTTTYRRSHITMWACASSARPTSNHHLVPLTVTDREPYRSGQPETGGVGSGCRARPAQANAVLMTSARTLTAACRRPRSACSEVPDRTAPRIVRGCTGPDSGHR
jgi:hypothetical protein